MKVLEIKKEPLTESIPQTAVKELNLRELILIAV